MDDKIVKEEKVGWLKRRTEEKRVKVEERWQLSLWSPSAFEWNAMIWLSPIHIYYIWILNLENSLEFIFPMIGNVIMVCIMNEKVCIDDMNMN